MKIETIIGIIIITCALTCGIVGFIQSGGISNVISENMAECYDVQQGNGESASVCEDLNAFEVVALY